MKKYIQFFVFSCFFNCFGNTFAQKLDQYVRAADSCEKINDFQCAVSNYSQALENKPADGGAAYLYYKLASAQTMLNQENEAIDNYTKSLTLKPDGLTFQARGLTYYRTKKYQLAIEDFEKALGYFKSPRTQAPIYSKIGDCQAALKLYNEALISDSLALVADPEASFSYWGRAMLYYKIGNYMLELADYNSAIRFMPDLIIKARFYDYRANAERACYQFDNALSSDSLCLNLYQGYSVAYLGLGSTYLGKGDFLLAIANFEKASALNIDHKIPSYLIYNEIAECEFCLRDYNKALSECELSIKEKPDNSTSIYIRAKTFLKLNRGNEASDNFKKALLLDTAKNSSDYAFMLFYTGNANGALSTLINKLLASKNSYDAVAKNYNIACLYSLLNKPVDAIAYLKKALDGGEPKKYVFYDSDFDNIRNTKEFKNIIPESSK